MERWAGCPDGQDVQLSRKFQFSLQSLNQIIQLLVQLNDNPGVTDYIWSLLSGSCICEMAAKWNEIPMLGVISYAKPPFDIGYHKMKVG